MMDKIYYDDADINASYGAIYAKGRSYRYVYKDSSFSTKYPSDELFMAYLNGDMIYIHNSDGYDEYIIPTGFKWVGNIGYISYSVRYNDSGPTTFIGIFEGGPMSEADIGSASKTVVYMLGNEAWTDEDHTYGFTTTALKEAFLSGAVISLPPDTPGSTDLEYATPVGYFETVDGNNNICGNLMYIPFITTDVRIGTARLRTLIGFPDGSDPSDLPTTIYAPDQEEENDNNNS